jgi:hypothetical protein
MFVWGVNSDDGDRDAGPKRLGASIGIVAVNVKRPDHAVILAVRNPVATSTILGIWPSPWRKSSSSWFDDGKMVIGAATLAQWAPRAAPS